MSCAMCKERGKTWNGGDPRCAFDGDHAGNWNCATVNAIRDICYEGQPTMPAGVDYRYCDDQKYATLDIHDIDLPGGAYGLALWVTWYKNRGHTDAVWILSDDQPPRIPTEGELLAIIAAYRRTP